MIEFEQHPSETLDYSVDFFSHCVRRRLPNTDYALNTAVQPMRVTGWQYVVTSAGRSGHAEPRWPTTNGQTVVDGSVIWTAEPISSQSLLRSLSGATWSSTTGLTIGTPSTTGTRSTVLISGGRAGQDYTVTCVASCNDGTAPVLSFVVKFRTPARVVDV